MNELPTLFRSNMLLLICLVSYTFAGKWVEKYDPQLGPILAQGLFILAPALLFLRITKFSFVDILRIRWAGYIPTLLSMLIGLGLGFWAIPWLQGLQQISTPLFSMPLERVPQDWAHVIMYFIGWIIVTPVCKTILIYGVLLRGYERLGRVAAVAITAFICLVIPPDPINVGFMLPVAVLLSLVVLRTHSIFPAILMHAAYHIPFGVETVAKGMEWNKVNAFLDLSAPGLVGLLIAAGAYIALEWYSRHCLDINETEDMAVFPYDSPVWIVRHGLGILATLFCVFAFGRQVIAMSHPELVADSVIMFSDPGWDAPVRMEYQIYNLDSGAPAGTVICTVIPGMDEIQLKCETEFVSQQMKKKTGEVVISRIIKTQISKWDKATLQLLEGEYILPGEKATTTARIYPNPDGMKVNVKTSNFKNKSVVMVPFGVMVDDEMPWRLSSLQFDSMKSWNATIVYPFRVLEQSAERPFMEDIVIQVQNSERLLIGEKEWKAWKVTAGKWVAYYDVESPHMLLQLETGSLIYKIVLAP